MNPGLLLWEYWEGDDVVYEIEHLFGSDVIIAHKYEADRVLPQVIITLPRALNPSGRIVARMALIWRINEQWSYSAQAQQDLHEPKYQEQN